MCRTCGQDDCMETAMERHNLKPVGRREPPKRERMPRQYVRPGRGVAGYRGDVEIYDPAYPHITFVDEPADPEPEPEPETKQREPAPATKERRPRRTKSRANPVEEPAEGDDSE